MLKVRLAQERGHADHGWLKAYHTFSFSDYYDPENMGFSVLRVINEDRVSAGMGFPTHGHADMEIITYIISGALQHKDTLGNTAIIRPGEVQYMCAGTGIRHSEFNPSKDQPTHLLQIWILPDKKGHAPNYGQKSFLEALNAKNFVRAASYDGAEGSIKINQDVSLYVARFKKGEKLEYKMKEKRSFWLQMVHGQLTVNNEAVGTSDGLAGAEEGLLSMVAQQDSEFLFFDMPG